MFKSVRHVKQALPHSILRNFEQNPHKSNGQLLSLKWVNLSHKSLSSSGLCKTHTTEQLCHYMSVNEALTMADCGAWLKAYTRWDLQKAGFKTCQLFKLTPELPRSRWIWIKLDKVILLSSNVKESRDYLIALLHYVHRCLQVDVLYAFKLLLTSIVRGQWFLNSFSLAYPWLSVLVGMIWYSRHTDWKVRTRQNLFRNEGINLYRWTQFYRVSGSWLVCQTKPWMPNWTAGVWFERKFNNQ